MRRTFSGGPPGLEKITEAVKAARGEQKAKGTTGIELPGANTCTTCGAFSSGIKSLPSGQVLCPRCRGER